MRQAVVIFTALLCIEQAGAQTLFQGDVVRILDGDTVEVLDMNKQTHRVRLANIDAPERRQAFGEVSRQALATMAYRQRVEVLDRGGDQYGRRIGVLTLNGRDLNAAMVAQGMAWVYTRYNNDHTLPPLEKKARMARLGLWADKSPTPPWEFRRAR